MNDVLRVEEYRGGTLENVHPVLVCIVDENNNVLYSAGDIEHPTFYRSAMKPIQAVPVFSAGVVEKYGLTPEESAIFTASHRGESYHQKVLLSIMEKLGVEEEQLVCHATYPLNDAPKQACLWNHIPQKKVFHNCSGKHFGFMAACRENHWPIEGYEHPNHPLQQRILSVLSELAEVPHDRINAGTDGCGVPVYAVPLKNMATSYLKFACPDLVADKELAQTVGKIGKVMNENPQIVASDHFICTELLRDPNIIAKGGAQGVYCFSLRKERISIALKVLTGSELVWPVVISYLLEKISYENLETIRRVKGLRDAAIMNDNGVLVGKTIVKE